SQKYLRAKKIIQKLSSGAPLVKDELQFGDNLALGLALPNGGNMLLFSKRFNELKYTRIEKGGYEFQNAHVEYIVYWYDAEEEKEYRVVLPRLHFKVRDNAD
ncbi:MAG: hypothetical protein HKN53_11365, partial [Maribacter sp.]|nr:hypothetical protein [Maribacter sp.]